ncbi:MAG: cation-translocating P-type ATPase [Anaerolineales bacterium]|nr:cation-translocating P-type ATPase [Anaerolineales bacterium]
MANNPTDRTSTTISTVAWHAEPVEVVESKLGTQIQTGLTPEEAGQRLAELGPNELREAPRPPFWRLVLQQFTSFVVLILIVASGISAVLGEWVEAIAIMAIVLLNAIIGVIQESKAEEALAALKKLAAPNATVIRGGAHTAVPSRELVPGDVVVLEDGNYVPADVRLVEAINLRIEEAALTGESVPVEKSARGRLEADIPLGDRYNTAFMGTLVARGRGRGVVVGTGMHTQMGLIAQMLQTLDNEPTPLQMRLEELGKQLGTIALVICGLVFLVAAWQQTDLAVLTGQGLEAYFHEYSTELSDFFLVAIGLAIAAVPEGLPAVVTITLAIGMREMVRRHALIRRLASVETLGAASVICSDKTGTLTQNQMTVVRVWVDDRLFTVTGEGYDPHGAFLLNDQQVDLTRYPGALTTLWAADLASDAYLEAAGSTDSAQAYRVVGDPTEGALVVVAAKAGALKADLERAYPRINEVPFDSERKRMSTILDVVEPHRSDPSPFHEDSEAHGQIYVVTTKGAPDVVLKHCTHYQRMDDAPVPLNDALRARILAANAAMAKEALRVLAVAFRTVPEPPKDVSPEAIEQDLVFLGMFGMIDPPRPEAPPAVSKARQAGIRTIMITGDYPDTAAAIARSIGLLQPGREVMPGAQLEALDDASLVKALATTDVFARVNPQHKVRIVEALRQRHEVVAMTGDGVNDAPALKRADIGVAMGITGTDVAKETADMVLTDDNFASIVSAVEQGRIIYANIRKFVFFLLSSNVAEIMIIFLATLAGLPSPLTAIQLLWLNLVTDGAPALALAMEKGDPDVMQHKPRPKSEPIVHGPMRLGIVVQTIAQTSAVLVAFGIGLLWHLGTTSLAAGNSIAALIAYDWSGIDVQTAETMAFVTLSLAELFRAFTVRSERISIFRMGFFSNRYLVGAVALSFALVLLTVFVPFLNPIFNTHPLAGREWGVVLSLAILPAIAEEVTKWWLRRRGD